MRITLYYRPFYNEGDNIVTYAEGQTLYRRDFSIAGTAESFQEALRAVKAEAAARYAVEAKMVIGDYSDHPPLQEGGTYYILSADERASIIAMQQ